MIADILVPERQLNVMAGCREGEHGRLSVENPEDIEVAALLATLGVPIASACGEEEGPYGLFGNEQAFVAGQFFPTVGERWESIGAMKDRDFRAYPPVGILTLEALSEVVDWESLGQEAHKLVEVLNKVEGPIHLVLPVSEKASPSLPFVRQREDGRLTHAFMMVGLVGYIEILAQQYERNTPDTIGPGRFLYGTSANRRGETTLPTSTQVLEAFPDLPAILISDLLDQQLGGCSHGMIDMTELPISVEIKRRPIPRGILEKIREFYPDIEIIEPLF